MPMRERKERMEALSNASLENEAISLPSGTMRITVSCVEALIVLLLVLLLSALSGRCNVSVMVSGVNCFSETVVGATLSMSLSMLKW